MDINSFIYPHQFNRPNVPPTLNAQPMQNTVQDDVITLKVIINEKPPTNIVREFMRYNLSCIVSEEESLFGNSVPCTK